MSKGVERYQVFRTTRVRTALKNDASWILKSKDEEERPDKAGTTNTEKTSPVRQKSYVLSAARRFGSIDSSVCPPLQKTEVTPSEGHSANHSNGDAIPAHKEPEPEGPTVDAAADIKPQETTEELVPNGDAHPETSGENGEAVGDESNVEHSDGGAEAPADVPVEDSIQPAASVEENTEAAPPVKPLQQPLAETSSENLEEPADTAADLSNTGHSEVGVTAAANVDDPSGEISVVDGSVESNGTTEINAASETPAQPEGESCEKAPAEQATDENIIASPEVTEDSSTETIDFKSTASVEETVVTSVASVPDIVESVSESPSQPASEIIAVDSSSQAEAEGTEEIVTAAEVVEESLPAVSETTQAEEAAPHNAVQTVPDILSEPSAPPDAETAAEDNSDKHHAESATELIEAAAEVVLESSPATTAIINSTQEEDGSPPPAAPSAEETIAENISEEHPAGGGTEVTIKAAAEVVVESSPATTAIINSTQEEDGSPPPAAPSATETTAENISEEHPAGEGTEVTIKAAAEVVLESSPATTAIINSTQEEDGSPPPAAPSAELTTAENISEEHPAGEGTEVTIKAAAEVVVESSPMISAVNETTQEEEAPTEEVVECEVQSTVEQSIDPTPESAAVVELDIKNALEPAEASDAEAIPAKAVDQTIKLTDALDVEIPETTTVPEPVEDPKPTVSEESQPSQHCNGTNTAEDVPKPAEELNSTTAQNKYRYVKGICSFCDQKISGTVKISLSDPLVECHPECLKCGICALALGDLRTPMFLRSQVIQCGSCFAEALKI